MPSDLFYDEIRLTKLPFSHSESEFVWQIRLELKILSTQITLKRKNVKEKGKKNCSTPKKKSSGIDN
jgi:hypothetical protein